MGKEVEGLRLSLNNDTHREREREGEKDRAARTPAGKLMQLLLFFCLSFHFSSSYSPSSE